MGILFDRRLCPRELFWDDLLKECKSSSQTCGPEVIPCVSSCHEKSDGTYPSCQGCSVFATCRSGQIYDNLPCPGKLLWDDHKKRCVRKSTTCKSISNVVKRLDSAGPKNPNDPTTGGSPTKSPDGQVNDGGLKSKKEVLLLLGSETEITSAHACTRNCLDLPDGNYQSCHGCTYYVSCRNGRKRDRRLCPQGTSWDNVRKACLLHSSTCHTITGRGQKRPSAGTCVTECTGIEDGQYQSCKGCEHFVNCWEGSFKEVPCRRTGSGSYWDDVAKLCLPDSSTCKPGTTKSPPTGKDVTLKVVLPGVCITTCRGVEDGNYQSCISCRVFVTCKNGVLFDGRSCVQNQLWDDNLKQCAPTSSSCEVNTGPCVHSCKGVSNGNYPSCRGCHLFVTCSNGVDLVEKSCPGELVWDDDLKLCVPFSSTCNYGEREGPPEGRGQVEEKANRKTSVSPAPVPKATTQTSTTVSTTSPTTLPTTTPTTPTSTRVKTRSTSAAKTSTTTFPTTTEFDTLSVIGGKKLDDGNTTSVTNVTSLRGKASCISSCDDLPDGDYQSCFGCNIYVTCSNGNLYTRSCPSDLNWDNVKKICLLESQTCGPGFGGCVKECGSLWDGNYQSCKGCGMYVSCSNGVAHDERRCPGALVWDDLLKWCVAKSSTCSQDSQIGPPCVTSCEGLRDGDYQSCRGCHVHATCLNGKMTDNRPCPKDLVFDAVEGRCVTNSSTCGPGRGECIETCENLPNGDYMSCKGCTVYASCVDGDLHDNRRCVNNMKWDDRHKRCTWLPDVPCTFNGTEELSGPEDYNKTSRDEPPNAPRDMNVTYEGHIGNGVCISTCEGQLNGDYQSCQGCDVFATCLNGVLYDRRPCPDGLIWEDTIKHCLSTSTTCGPGRGGCITSCFGQNDGEYQSCHGCNVYVSCLNGVMEDDRPCPRGELWDDQRKRCERSSTTCSSTHKSVVQAGVCVYDCEAIPDGEYQSCYGCTGYATCTSGVLHDSRPCPIGLVWDDIKKRCRYTSPTCGPGRGECTRTCDGLPDGNFQSCSGCNVYATCMEGILHDDRPCPGRLVWDDTTKRCMRTSNTCGRRRGGGWHQNGAASPDPALELARHMGSSVRAFSLNCVSSCEGRSDGDYQSCQDCRVFVTCSDGVMNDNRACPVSTLWDDNQKRCLRTSSTCTTVIMMGGRQSHNSQRQSHNSHHQQSRQPLPHYNPPQAHAPPEPQRRSGPGGNCISDCIGRSNANYQSCLDCRVYATCLFGVLHDNRPCPIHTIWDDRKKRCLYESSTCYLPGFGRPTSAPRRTSNRRPHRRNHGRRPQQRSRSRAPTRSVSVGECISSCRGVSDGNYQSCRGCSVFISCIRGRYFDARPCPSGLVWNDQIRRCDFSSETCRT